jgi:hypothetical protein
MHDCSRWTNAMEIGCGLLHRRERTGVGPVLTLGIKESRMKLKNSCAALFFGACLLQISWTALQASLPERTLEVKVNYTGSGSVDAKHKIFC